MTGFLTSSYGYDANVGTLACVECKRTTKVYGAPGRAITDDDTARLRKTHVHGPRNGAWDVLGDEDDEANDRPVVIAVPGSPSLTPMLRDWHRP